MQTNEYMAAVRTALAELDCATVELLARAVYSRFFMRRTVYIFGNGGSGANASHFCEDLAKCTDSQVRVLSLTDNVPYILALANDCGFENVFVEQLKCLAVRGDLAVAVSGSGNSPNVLRAVDWANVNGLETFGVTGLDGGQLARTAQRCLYVPSPDIGVVETVHLAVFHSVIGLVRDYIAEQVQKCAEA